MVAQTDSKGISAGIMKRNIIILLIALSVGVTVYINSTKQTLAPELKSQIENALLQEPEFPARPVWWEDDKLLALGVVKTQDDHSKDAEKACRVIAKHGVKDLKVELYDVVKIQKADEWTLIGKAFCK